MKNLYLAAGQILVCFSQTIHISVPLPFAESQKVEGREGERGRS